MSPSVPAWFVPVLLMAMMALAGVAIPPVLEDHVEPGFCSADCPVQHPGHGSVTPPPPVPTAPRRSPVVVVTLVPGVRADLAAVASLHAPRAPPSA
jgi:hypothetical protein